jgi:hypothetical protein
MSIKVKTRKILWSKSGNRCAICKKQLVQKLPTLTSDFIVGEECHIISSKELGPRSNVKRLEDYDTYDNFILLCANDHKLIDEFPETFTVDILNNVKANHENSIESALEKDLEEYIKSLNKVELLEEITSTSHIDIIVRGSHFHFYDFSTVTDNNLSVEVSELFDNLRDYGDIYDDIEVSSRTRCLIDYMESIKKINGYGIRFFGKSIVREYAFLKIPKSEYKIAMIIAFKVDVNPNSIQNGKLMVKIPDDFHPGL